MPDRQEDSAELLGNSYKDTETYRDEHPTPGFSLTDPYHLRIENVISPDFGVGKFALSVDAGTLENLNRITEGLPPSFIRFQEDFVTTVLPEARKFLDSNPTTIDPPQLGTLKALVSILDSRIKTVDGQYTWDFKTPYMHYQMAAETYKAQLEKAAIEHADEIHTLSLEMKKLDYRIANKFHMCGQYLYFDQSTLAGLEKELVGRWLVTGPYDKDHKGWALCEHVNGRLDEGGEEDKDGFHRCLAEFTRREDALFFAKAAHSCDEPN